MILSDLRSWETEKHAYAPAIQRAVGYLQNTDFFKFDAGKYPLEGEMMFALVQEVYTQDKQQRRAESHRTFIDVQFLIEGEEKIGVAKWTPDQAVSEDRLDKDDIAFYSGVEHESDIVLLPGMFAVLFPSDIHRPCCSCNSEGSRIRKTVIKINKRLLGEEV